MMWKNTLSRMKKKKKIHRKRQRLRSGRAIPSSSLKKQELNNMCKQNDVNHEGTKVELIQRLSLTQTGCY
jgi:hypothetical protein